MKIDMQRSTIKLGAASVPFAAAANIIRDAIGPSLGTALAFETNLDGALERIEHDGERDVALDAAATSALTAQIAAAPEYLPAYKQASHAMAANWRAENEAGGFDYSGKSWQSDLVSAQRIMGGKMAADSDPAFSQEWTATDNTTIMLDQAGMQGLFAALASHATSTFETAKTAKNAINAATTVDEINAALATLA